jgi:hypothetical protein
MPLTAASTLKRERARPSMMGHIQRWMAVILLVAALPTPGASPRAGGQVGYNWQFSRRWVVGIEADFDASNIRGNGTSRFMYPIFTLPQNAFFGEPANLHSTEDLNWFGTVIGVHDAILELCGARRALAMRWLACSPANVSMIVKRAPQRGPGTALEAPLAAESDTACRHHTGRSRSARDWMPGAVQQLPIAGSMLAGTGEVDP